MNAIAQLMCCIYVFNLVQAFSDLKIAMIRDTIDTFKQPIAITAFTCNNIGSVNMMKMLSNKGIPSSVQSSKYPLPNPFPSHHVLFVIDLDCNHAFQLLAEAEKENKFLLPYRWLIVNTIIETAVIKNVLNTFKILLDSDVTLAQYSKEAFDLVKLYKMEEAGLLQEETFGRWNVNESFVELEGWNYARRKFSKKITLNVSMVITENDTLMHLTDRKEQHVDTISKVSYALLQHLSDILNVSYKYIVQKSWGYKINEVEWNGMIGDLQRGDATIGGTVVFLRGDRIPVVDYVGMTIPTRSKFVFKQPKLTYVSNVYILPFNWTVWASIGATGFFLFFAIYITGKWEFTTQRLKNQNLGAVNVTPNWVDSMLIVCGAVCQQGSSITPSSIPGRIATILMFISLMFIYTAYSANIVALLQSSSNSIQTLNDLLRSRLSVGVDDTVFNRFYFPNASEPVRKAIYERKVAPPKQKPRYYEIREGIQMMRNGHFAFHMETGVGYKFVLETFEEHEKCGLNEIQFLQVSDPCLAIRKKLPYKKLIKIGLMQIRETGLQSREVSLLYTKKPSCVNRASSFISVTIVDCYFATSILFVGVIVALVILTLEIAFYRKQKFHFCTFN